MARSKEEKLALEDWKTKVIAFRFEIDGLHRMMSFMFESTGGHDHIYDAIIAARLAKAHLGNTLGQMGVPNPYKVADKRENIPAEETTNMGYLSQYTYLDDFQYTNIVREHLHKLMEKMRDAVDFVYSHKFISAFLFKWPLHHMEHAYMKVSETANHLGFYLGHMREEDQK